MTSVGSEPQYEPFADDFAVHARDGFYNAHYDRPACLSLLGDVAGRHVLDVGCGPGWYAAELTSQGARVSAFDLSPRMAELTRLNAPDADVRVHDAARPLTWMPDGSVDLALWALGVEYVDDRVGTLRELRRVLRPFGALVLSRLHPTGDWLRHGGSYFDTRVIDEDWAAGWHVRYWLAPLERTCEELHEAGFLIERLLEPRPAPSAEAIDPDDFARLSSEPRGFLAIRAVPRPGVLGTMS